MRSPSAVQLTLHISGALVLWSLASCRSDYGATGATDPGFTEAYFDEEDLSELVKSDKATRFHFYNVMKEEGGGSVVAMGADDKDQEVYSFLTGPWYRCFMELEVAGADCNKLIQDDASRMVENVRRSGLTTYCAIFSKAEVMGLFKVDDCNAVRVKPERTADSRYWTMRIAPVNIADGRITELGATHERACTQPCPTYCGADPANFLHCR